MKKIIPLLLVILTLVSPYSVMAQTDTPDPTGTPTQAPTPTQPVGACPQITPGSGGMGIIEQHSNIRYKAGYLAEDGDVLSYSSVTVLSRANVCNTGCATTHYKIKLNGTYTWDFQTRNGSTGFIVLRAQNNWKIQIATFPGGTTHNEQGSYEFVDAEFDVYADWGWSCRSNQQYDFWNTGIVSGNAVYEGTIDVYREGYIFPTPTPTPTSTPNALSCPVECPVYCPSGQECEFPCPSSPRYDCFSGAPLGDIINFVDGGMLQYQLHCTDPINIGVDGSNFGDWDYACGVSGCAGIELYYDSCAQALTPTPIIGAAPPGIDPVGGPGLIEVSSNCLLDIAMTEPFTIPMGSLPVFSFQDIGVNQIDVDVCVVNYEYDNFVIAGVDISGLLIMLAAFVTLTPLYFISKR